ncbi:equilibrative nucleoside transporter 4-like [Lingula anatina]|uniref:Equilibrative nucleoside transporter 4-like n=1 Tax=Lingula anatina TaxID=7574 RepID=A0A1S3IC71_LINAN|nr:equilibrative nucleoside transporter 4-like [Lingula anatina]|eukprot:XP_013395768.1 equilibrative nucleoside transporter 4-like [Lingula anatina]
MDENLSRGYVQLSKQRASVSSIGGQSSESGQSPSGLNVPHDTCSCIYLGLILAGAGFLLPYNSFIIAVDYYQDRFPDTTIVFDMSLTYICVAFVSVCINNVLVELLSLHTRITVGYVISFLTLLSVALFDVWFELLTRDSAYRVTLVAVGTVALGCTVQQSSFYGYTSMLPMRYTQAVMTGESAAGLLVSANRIVTKALLNDEKVNTMIFFCISVVTVFACFVIFNLIRRTEFARFYENICRTAGKPDDKVGFSNQTVMQEEVEIVDHTTNQGNYGVLVIEHDDQPRHAVSSSSSRHSIADDVRIKSEPWTVRRPTTIWAAIKHGVVLRKRASRTTWPYMMSIAFAYFVTLCLFPGIESEILSCRLGSWMPVVLMAIFNASDFIGKIIASLPYDWPPRRLLACSILRVLLIPLMMMCATPRLGPILNGEGWAMLISLILGVTNGYFGSVPMILASTKVPDEQKELTGNMMTLTYSIGLTTGSVMAYGLDDWLGPRLPHDPCLVNNATLVDLLNGTISSSSFG